CDRWGRRRQRRAQAGPPATLALGGGHVLLRQRAHPPLDHAPLGRAEDPGHQRWKEQSGSLPVIEQVVAEETPADVAGDRDDDHLAPGTMIRRGADDDRRPELPARLIREHEPHEDDVASPNGGHTPRPSGCPRAPRAPGPPSRSTSASPRLRPPGPPAIALRLPPARIAGP